MLTNASLLLPAHLRVGDESSSQSAFESLQFRLSRVQAEIFKTEATEIWYGGAAGGGKSHILRVVGIFFCLSIPSLNVFLFRRKRPDLIRTHLRGPTGFPRMLAPLIASGHAQIAGNEVRFFHDNNEVSTIFLCHCKDEGDIYNYLSNEMHVTLNDEVSEFTEHMYRMQRSRARYPSSLNVPDHLKQKLPLTINASNPGGNLHLYLKKNFYDPVEPRTVWRASRSDGGRLRVFIPAKISDNKHINREEYTAALEGLGNEELVRMYRDGDMNVVLGSYFKTFGLSHICEPFEIPEYWTRFRAIDWGYSPDPFVCLWFAVSDGSVEGFGKGDLIVYREIERHELVADEQAQLVRELSQGEEIAYTVIDPSAYGKRSVVGRGRKGVTIAETYRREGVPVQRADNARVMGWQELQKRLKHIKIHVLSTCRRIIETLPLLEHCDRNPADVKEKGADDHHGDALRYGVMSRPLVTTATKEIPKDRQSALNILRASGVELEEFEKALMYDDY